MIDDHHHHKKKEVKPESKDKKQISKTKPHGELYLHGNAEPLKNPLLGIGGKIDFKASIELTMSGLVDKQKK